MNKHILHEAMNYVDEDLLEEALLAPKKKRSFRWQPLAMAACFALVLFGAARVLPGFLGMKSSAPQANEMIMAPAATEEKAEDQTEAAKPETALPTESPVLSSGQTTESVAVEDEKHQYDISEIQMTYEEAKADQTFGAYVPELPDNASVECWHEEDGGLGILISMKENWEILWTVSSQNPGDAIPVEELTEEMLSGVNILSVDYGGIYVTVESDEFPTAWLWEQLQP